MIAEDFFEMEKKYKLFDLRTADNIPIWDIVRMYVYLKYYFPKTEQNLTVQKTSFKEYVNFVFGLFRSFFYFIFKNGENFFLPVSRNVDKSGRYFDKAAISAIEAAGSRAFIFEMQSVNRRYKYNAANNYIEYFKKFSSDKEIVSFSIFSEIELALISVFKDCKVAPQDLNQIYKDFKLDELYYGKIFRIKKVKKVFITNNGFKKGLFQAAKNLDIPIYEFQHGSFEMDHLAYSYPSFVKQDVNVLLPDYLLTIGDYWGNNFNVPIKCKVSVGNDSFFLKHSSSSEETILFISSKIHGRELYIVAIKLAIQFPGMDINFKLHSNEFADQMFYANEFKDFRNIHLIKPEIHIHELIRRAAIVILISSTVFYEALNQNKKVAIYKRANYDGLRNLFNLPNVYLFDSGDEIASIMKNETINNNVNFFKPFDKKLFFEIANFN